jgi:hypothetical protein
MSSRCWNSLGIGHNGQEKGGVGVMHYDNTVGQVSKCEAADCCVPAGSEIQANLRANEGVEAVGVARPSSRQANAVQEKRRLRMSTETIIGM